MFRFLIILKYSVLNFEDGLCIIEFMDKTYLTANQFQQDSIYLATKALKNYKPDLILALWRGGATPAIILT